MSSNKKIPLFHIVVPLLIAAVSLLVFITWRSIEPRYQGKPLSYWLARISPTPNPGVARGVRRDQQAAEAIRQIGTNALPILLAMTKAHDSELKKLALKWSPNLPLININFTPANDLSSRARYAYQALGHRAKSAVPALVVVLSDTNRVETQRHAANALGAIGRSAAEAVPALVNAAKDQDPGVRNNARVALLLIQGNFKSSYTEE